MIHDPCPMVSGHIPMNHKQYCAFYPICLWLVTTMPVPWIIAKNIWYHPGYYQPTSGFSWLSSDRWYCHCQICKLFVAFSSWRPPHRPKGGTLRTPTMLLEAAQTLSWDPERTEGKIDWFILVYSDYIVVKYGCLLLVWVQDDNQLKTKCRKSLPGGQRNGFL